MSADRESQRQTLRISLLLLGGVLALTLAAWRHGSLQPLDFLLYDQFLRDRPPLDPAESPVVLIAMTEEDIRARDYPIPDAQLAELLQVLESCQPRAIGLDLYRDLPEPRSGEGLAALNRTLATHSNIVVIRRLPDAANPAIAPPAVMTNYPERVGFNNFPIDAEIGHKIRRGLLFAGCTEGGRESTCYSFALRLALLSLEKEAIGPTPAAANPDHLQLGRQIHVPLRRHDGAYVDLDTSGYQVLLEYGGPSSFPVCSISAVLAGRYPPATFRDKVLVIGSMAESVRDEHNTPVKPEAFGAELHGQLVTQLILRAREPRPALRFLSEWQETILAVGGAMLGMLLAWSARSAGLFVGLLAGGLVLLVGLNQWAFHQGWWVPVAPVAVALAASAVLVTTYRVQREWRERRVLMRLFSKHVSSEIAAVIWTERHRLLHGKRPRPLSLTATVLFADLKDFTALAEKTDPAAVMEWLNEFTAAMSAHILRHGGIINEFTGDGLMATFGIPIPRQTEAAVDGDARAAVASALAMGEELVRLNRQWQSNGRPTASMRVGVATGPVVTGSLGGTDRLKYAVVGDTVNAAARLESYDKDGSILGSQSSTCRILVAEATWARLGGLFAGELAGAFALKGKEQPINVYQAFGRKP